MAHLHVKTPGGTTYSIDLDVANSGGGSVTESGFAYLNNGATIQWGTDRTDEYRINDHTVTFPISFGTACYSVQINPGYATSLDGSHAAAFYVPQLGTSATLTKSNFKLRGECKLSYWIAIGA